MYLSVEAVFCLTIVAVIFAAVMAFKEDEIINAIEKLINRVAK